MVNKDKSNEITWQSRNKFISIYYFCRKFIPRWLQIFLRKTIVSHRLLKYKEIWPIDKNAGKKPDYFCGWPNNKSFAFLLRHDVETTLGLERCYQLADIEKKLGFVSVFNFVPERYTVSDDLLTYLVNNGFEVGVHGLKHDGKLYRNRKTFQKRVIKINYYLKKWNSCGFASPSSHHNLELMHELNVKYDSSTFDTDPFEPQPDGVRTIFPILVKNNSNLNRYIEIPYTLPQDFTVFILMKEKTIDIWKKKLEWINLRNGMALLNTHPDYINFSGNKRRKYEYPIKLYIEFLEYVKTKFIGKYSHILPKQMADYWRRAYKKNNKK